jgi:hypothetical protein
VDQFDPAKSQGPRLIRHHKARVFAVAVVEPLTPDDLPEEPGTDEVGSTKLGV